MRESLRAALFIVDLALGAWSVAVAQAGLPPAKELPQYAHRVWTTGHALPHNEIRAIAQSPEGYLWVGTPQGLARFDGLRFVTFNVGTTPALRDPTINSLCQARDGTLWIGTAAGLVLRAGDAIRRCRQLGPLDAQPTTTLYEDGAGRVWAGTPEGLFAIFDSTKYGEYGREDGLTSTAILAIGEEADGSILVSAGGMLMVLREGRFALHPAALRVQGIVTAIARDAGGALWIGTSGRGLYRCAPDGSVRNYGRTEGLPSPAIRSLMADPEGPIWFGTSEGFLCRYEQGRFSRVNTREGFVANDVCALLRGREGELWVGTTSSGLHRFLDGVCATYRVGALPAEQKIWCVTEDRDKAVIVSNEAGGIYKLVGGSFRQMMMPAFTPPGIPISILRDRSGTLWLGTSEGLYRENRSGRHFFPLGKIHALLEDRRGTIWAGMEHGLFQFCGDVPRWYGTEIGLKNTDVRCLVETREGDLWVGTSGGGIVRLRPTLANENVPDCPGTYAVYQKEDGLLSNWITALHEDEEGLVWVGTMGSGLNLIRDGRVTRFTAAEGLPETAFLSVLSDGAGSLWCGSRRGIVCLDRVSMLRLERGESRRASWVSYGMDDGMIAEECCGGYQASAFRTRDGRLWFPTESGVVGVDPQRVRPCERPLTVAIDPPRIDGQEAGEAREFPHGSGSLEFHYVGLSLRNPQRVQYRFMLEGFSSEWTEANGRQVSYYTNIPPGTYTFRVRALCCGRGCVESAGSYAFVLSPHFYQTTWFSLGIVAALVALAGGAFQLYRRDRERELRASRLESQLSQAKLRVLEMQLRPHFLFNTLNSIMVLIGRDPAAAERTLAKLSDLLRHTLERSGVQEVPLREELETLERYLAIEKVRFGDRLEIRITVPPELSSVPVPTMVLQPIAENALRHGLAEVGRQALIEIDAWGEGEALVLAVRDNGSGLPVNGQGSMKEGIGLGNTRARLRQLYGERASLEVSGLPSGGVEVEIHLPRKNRR
jgi:ligand-binding sensor domain-containing protein/two-component sensor histidine kinase